MKSIVRIAMFVLLAAGLVACGDDDNERPESVVEAAREDGRFTTLLAALEAADLDEALETEGPFTVFAPTDAAFDLLPAGLIDLSGGAAPALAGVVPPDEPTPLTLQQVAEILRYHVVAGEEIQAADISDGDVLDMFSGGDIDVQIIDGTVVLNGTVQVTETNIFTENGVVHVIDAVLVDGEFPGSIADALIASPRFSTLVGALVTADLAGAVDGLEEATVFAPTNAAFDLLPEGLVAGLGDGLGDVLLYHVIGEELDADDLSESSSESTLQTGDVGVQVDGDTGGVVLDGRVQVTFADIEADNGIIHVVDAVLVPGAFPGTVVDALSASPRFSTLVGAVVSQGLAGTLADEAGTFTVFAPTNAGFERLPDGLVASLGDGLAGVLLYHVLGSQVDSTTAVGAAGSSVPTVSPDGGGFFAVSVDVDDDSDLYLDGRTQVTAVDIVTDNGIIHVIDSVLVPGVDFPGTTVEALTSYPRFDALVGAVVGEGLAGAVTNVTLFAPTNDAFDSVGSLGPFTLAEVLSYHLLAQPLLSGELMASETTLQGDDITISVGGDVLINGTSEVIFLDISTSDGVIHVIDEVLVPPFLE